MGLDLLRIGIQKDSDILKNPCFRKKKKKNYYHHLFTCTLGTNARL